MFDHSKYVSALPPRRENAHFPSIGWDTMVATRHGDVLAGDIQPGTELLTSSGFEKVLDNQVFVPAPKASRIIKRGALGAKEDTFVSSGAFLNLSHWSLRAIVGVDNVTLLADQLPETHVQKYASEKQALLLCQLVTRKRVLISCNGLGVYTALHSESRYPSTCPLLNPEQKTECVDAKLTFLNNKGCKLLNDVPRIFGKIIEPRIDEVCYG